MLVDVASALGITGRQAEEAVRRCGITLNRNPIPFDPNGPWYTSGLRFGTPAVTTLGMGVDEMKEIAAIVTLVLQNIVPATTKSGAKDKTKYKLDEEVRRAAHGRVDALLGSFPGLSRDRPAVPARELRDGLKSYPGSQDPQPIAAPEGSEINHGIHRNARKREPESTSPFRVLPGGDSRP